MAGWQLTEYSPAAKFKTCQCQGKGGILPSMPVNLKGLGYFIDR